MILKVISKYGLAAHLGLLAAFPVAFAPFVDIGTLGGILLWLSFFALIWIFFDPSIRIGEHTAQARRRVFVSVIRDPAFYLFLLIAVFALVRWLNSGIALWYDAEHGEWMVKEAEATILPASTPGTGFMPMSVAVAICVLVIGIRHSLGLSARIFCGLTATVLAGAGGLAASIYSCLETVPMLTQAAKSDFMQTPFAGTAFGMMLIFSITMGAAAECRKWASARLPYVLAVAGTSSGLVFFSPPVAVGGYLVVVLVFALFSFVYCARVGSMGGFARILVLTFLGLLVPAILIMALATPELREFKLHGLDFTAVFPVEYEALKNALARISKDMWISRPWCGVGLGAFGLNVPFLATKADWSVLPPHISNAVSGYWTLLAERGIVGCALLVAGIGVLFYSWCARLVSAFRYVRNNDDFDTFPFACFPVVWVAPFIICLAAIELLFSNVFASSAFIFAFTVPLVLSAASFPRKVLPPPGMAEESDKNGEG